MSQDAAKPPDDGEFERALSGIAARIAPDASGVAGLRQLSGGASQELWRFDLVSGEARTPLILRREPAARRFASTSVGAEVEAALIQAAEAAGAPVPPVRYVLRPEDGLGRGFVMGFIEGETLGGRIVKGEAFADARPKLARQCGEILARIHTIDPEPFPALKRMTPEALIGQWEDVYRAAQGAPRPVIELALRWLRDTCPPPPEKFAFVHGDFRNGNLIFGPDGVRAVLDWELAHVGDPMEDLGWLCANCWRYGIVGKTVGGFGDAEDLYAGYEAAGGAPVDRAAAHWWEVFASMRWGVMCAGALKAFRSVDPTPERAVIVRRASENEIDLMRLLAG